MSEAQYVCTGQVGKDQLSHYGLGLQKYTHFTSPIRRYADVVVHKQLLSAAAPPGKSSDASTAEKRTNVDPALVPDSKTISILAGEGIRATDQAAETTDEKEPNDNVVVTESQEPPEFENGSSVERVYSPRLVAKICDTLNRQNRMAKVRLL
jgi:DIS3-like exonuclease 1